MPTLGQIIGAVGSPPEWRAVDPEDLGIGGDDGFFLAGVKDHHFYNDEVEVGIINDETSANTGFGVGALSVVAPSGSDGKENTAVGYNALMANTTGTGNVAVGPGALLSSNSDYNIAIGVEALSNTTDGESNIAIGDYAMVENIYGSHNLAIGTYALYTAPGCEWGGDEYNDYNIAIGEGAMEQFLGGENNIAIGPYAFGNHGTGDGNIVIGNWNALGAMREGSYTEDNICIGSEVLSGYRDFVGYGENVIVGNYALADGLVAAQNVIIGTGACWDGSSSTLNTAIGYAALYTDHTYSYLTVGAADCNVSVGAFSGRNVNNLHYNVFLGYDASVHDPISSFTSPMGYTFFDIAPVTDALLCTYYDYGITFVFDDGSESNIVKDLFVSNACSNNGVAHWEIRLTSIPLHTTGFSPKVCVARNIYRLLERIPAGSIADEEYNALNYGRWGLVGTIGDNSTTTFNDSMSQTTLETQPSLLGPSMSIAIGAKARTINANQLVVGGGAIYPGNSPINGIKEAFFGNGVFAVAPMDFTLNATGGFGANVEGADLMLAGGRSTGTANGGSIKFQVTPASGGTNSFWNPLATALEIDSDKVIRLFNDTSGSGTPQLGTNCPANTLTGPYTWIKIKTMDNSVGYIPVWR